METIGNSSCSVFTQWLEAFYKLNNASKPKAINKAKWLDIHYNAITLFKNNTDILKSIIDNNWSIIDIFGCHYLAPTTRFDCMGLLFLKRPQDKIVEASIDRITLKTQNGIVKCFYKSVANKEQCLIYELENYKIR